MQEFRNHSAKLARASRKEIQQIVTDTLGSLNVVITQISTDIQDLKVRNGVIANDATRLAAQEATALYEPLRIQLDRIEHDLRDILTRIDDLEARSVGSGDLNSE